jgi:integrase
MPTVGRRRESKLGLPAGVRERGSSWYWQPTRERDREALRKQDLPVEVYIGEAGTTAARKKWAELTGRLPSEEVAGTVDELLTIYESGPIERRPNGRPFSKNTVKMYRRCVPVLREKFGTAKYGKTEKEVADGQAIGTAEIQRYISAAGSYASQLFAVLSNSFNNGIREGLTTYNPCDKVVAPAQNARGRAPLEWEVEALLTIAEAVIGLIIECKLVSGYRISELIRIHRRDMTPDGIRVLVKGGKWETMLWSPRMREIVAAAEALPTASRFPASPIFPHSRGKAYSYSGWYAAYQDLLAEVNAALAAGVIDSDTLEDRWPGMVIKDLHIHDVRSKVHEDAEDQGRKGHEAIGNTEGVSDRHYARREKRRRPLE